jgi:hypothetical protein
MTEANDVLVALERAGVRVEARDDGALVLTPGRLLTPELRAAALAVKPAIVALVRQNGAELSRHQRARDVAAVMGRIDRLVPTWPEGCLARMRAAAAALGRRLKRAEERVDAAGRNPDESGWQAAINEYEQAWREVAGHIEKNEVTK